MSDIPLEEIRELAARFARDFGISYDKISIKEKTGWVSFKTDSDNSGGWTEGVPAVTVSTHIIYTHYNLISIQETKARIDELEKLPVSDYEDVSDEGDETWFEYIAVEDRDKRLKTLNSNLSKEQS